MKNIKKNLIIVVKLFVTLLTIYLILKNIDLSITFELIANVGIPYLVSAMAVLLLQILVMTHRWKIVLNNLSINLSFKDIIRIFWIGLFFNQILPTSIGGDAMRGHYLYQRGYSFVKTSQGVLIDRIIGLIALVFLVIITLPLGLQLVDSDNARWGLIIILISSIFALTLLLNIDIISSRFQKWNLINKFSSIMAVIKNNIFSLNPGFKLLLISLLVHFLSILTMIILAVGMQLELKIIGLFVIVPVVTLLMMLPISIAGWGIREGAMIIGLGFLGVGPENAFALSLLYGLLMLSMSIPGGAIWVVTSKPGDIND
ncbi:flippase-like domain-containing protein [Amylibacter sp.]|nr:flippase-like domain-containing protein [Amylibacter sp.]